MSTDFKKTPHKSMAVPKNFFRKSSKSCMFACSFPPSAPIWRGAPRQHAERTLSCRMALTQKSCAAVFRHKKGRRQPASPMDGQICLTLSRSSAALALFQWLISPTRYPVIRRMRLKGLGASW